MKNSYALRKTIKAMLVGGCIMAVSGLAYADGSWLKGTTDEKITTLAELQPGLGTIMLEYSGRFTNMFYAAKGGNWDFADYQLKEAREIQEVGENTRPKRAEDLKKFESTYLDPIGKAIDAKDFQKFEAAVKEAVNGCNACHKKAGFKFIRYELPASAPTPILLKP
jgi:hypothetical protein